MGTLRDLQFALQLKIEELRQRDTLIDELELELDTKDELIQRLQEELDRYRATATFSACILQDEDTLSANRKTIISEAINLDSATEATASNRACEKSQKSLTLIQEAFLKNDLLKNLEDGEMKAIIACMHPITIHPGCYVFRDGSIGVQAYILEEGRLDVTKGGSKLLTVEPEDVFGEVALLYSCTYNYSVSAQTESKLWVIDRQSYQGILIQKGLNNWSQPSELLDSIPCLQPLPEDVLMKMSGVVEEAHYNEGDFIIQRESSGDTFYIIINGQVKVTEQRPGDEEQVVLYWLSDRQWFGEKALQGEEVQTLNVIAANEVTCLLVDRETFKRIILGLDFDCNGEMLQSDEYKDESDKDSTSLSSSTLSDFQILGTLEFGEFGHVDLVQLRSDPKCFCAMKVLKKKLILQKGQREHLQREQNILIEAHCPFIVRLHKTFSDSECLYLLTEACHHGNLYSLLKEKRCLDECSTKFYTACVVEALSFLHLQTVVYRDIKPENVLLDEHGYAKLGGCRCLKKLGSAKKTYTFCGSPGFMAPEIILTKGYGTSTDLWSLGVFVFELLSGVLPFRGVEPMSILTATIHGIDQIDFPKIISKNACSLIKELCRQNPHERLGSQRNGAKDIQKHKWFEGFDWDGLRAGTLNPPLIPRVQHLLDSSSCGHYAAELSSTWEDF